MDFKIDSLAYKKEFNKYKTEIQKYKDSTTYHLIGIDNGIYTFYVFKKNDTNKWLLKSIHDYSN